MIPTVTSTKLAFVTVTDLAPVDTAIVWSARRATPAGLTAFANAVRQLVAATR